MSDDDGPDSGAAVWPPPGYSNEADSSSDSEKSNEKQGEQAAERGNNPSGSKQSNDHCGVCELGSRKGKSGGDPKSDLKRLNTGNMGGYFFQDTLGRDLSCISQIHNTSNTRSSRSSRADSNHVCMPYQEYGKIPRWVLIISSLDSLRDVKFDFCDELVDRILRYNESYKHKWDFKSLQLFYTEHLKLEERQSFQQTILKMCDLVKRLPEICPEAIPFLKRGTESSITFSQKQIACLLANAFFCTFPMRNVDPDKGWKKDGLPLPTINFSGLFKEPRGGNFETLFNKLRCIMHYFERVTAKMPDGKVTYRRQCLKNDDHLNWPLSNKTFTKLHVSSEGEIESEDGMLQVDFANKMVGGGVIGRGCVQEEIRFLISPELIAARLFTETLQDNECLVVTGCERFSEYEGYSHSFKWKSDHVDTIPKDSFQRKLTQVVAMDAKKVRYHEDQFMPDFWNRELNKAFCGFQCDDHRSPKVPSAVATGNWGCGDFGGDKHLKSLIQMMAAAEAGRDVCYFTYGDDDMVDQLASVYKFLHDCRLTVGNLYQIIHQYGKGVRRRKNKRLFDYILKTYTQFSPVENGTPV